MANSKSNIKKALGELAKLAGGDVAGDRGVIISGLAGIDVAEEGDITFIANPKYIAQIQTTKASAIIISPDIKSPEGMSAAAQAGKNFLYAKNPYLAFAKVLELFYPPAKPYNDIHPDARIHQTAVIGESVSIYPNVFVDEGAKIGSRVVLYPGVYIGNNAEVGDDTVLYSNVSVREGCLIRKRVIIHCNSVIGSDGFGYAKDGTKYYKIPQKGIVRIEDDVEIGACVTIDRATLGETVIGRGTKIDNLVQIAHNVTIGDDSIIVAQVGIAGSAKIGKRVTLAGQVGVNGHIEIGDDVMIGAQSGVTSDVKSQQIYSGMPAIPHKEWLKAQTIFAKLPEMRKTLMELEKRVKELENTLGSKQ
ncbi:MAG: UDP-3-O-(3-hydroxymyristoyl)glucosamine N-acyltransferase [Deltaproteobacteria bacterium GWC2_42_51]|nr:MAG: UDP-3-O-(3-hydroxymyristoyl)glucosamine N-acyltransferase [Deltaproteobacteria bacterium GWA2_42_85]OGP25809.1 MAG: UDP-3-O-(3-hydroxymyristoyl)glucosamine N-acyltransferase [Deltaproteobacteria bacterium GWB2_42_7]OGP37087.1 MAG: UDP-3-O-(3-hydroxymyristoyl)glucosamine N-acyltransferase [Deltaproteobacteria bacterium GWC2_42_51]OGP37960.1 MAG: UDP-3-O-(3-hydroxymyristoyl)glucosamine N-acyltransferase [Deltaproteobacteria bacterium GWD2_42_10]OGP47766.1 MAG: UDP-3-O-(3-hydroxymyristoyl)